MRSIRFIIIKFMRSFHKNIIRCSIFLFLFGCANSPPWDNDFKLVKQEEPASVYFQLEKPFNEEEVYVWNPPEEEALTFRRSRQRNLDRLSRNVDKLLNNFDTVKEFSDSLEASVDRLGTRIEYIESAVSSIYGEYSLLQKDLAMLQSSVQTAISDVRALKDSMGQTTQ